MIKSLTYQVEKPEDFIADDAKTYEVPAARFVLTGGILTATLTKPVLTIDEARTIVDPIVRAWEFEAEVRHGFPQIGFRFNNGELEARTDSSTEHEGLVIKCRYPPAPCIRVSPEMENMWERYSRSHMLSGMAEPLPSAVYYSLTVVTGQFGSFKEAGKELNIDLKVLKKVSELSTVRGDKLSARKAKGQYSPLSRLEKRWLNHAIRLIILQLGLREAGQELPKLSMQDLPELKTT